MVLYGGTRTVAPDMQDTWEWDGINWSQRASVGPENRSDHAMAWFPPLGRTVLFGGVFQFYRAHSDLWTWDGKYCLYHGDNVWELTPEDAAGLLGVKVDDLGKPLLYRIPLGILILLGLGVGFGLWCRFSRA